MRILESEPSPLAHCHNGTPALFGASRRRWPRTTRQRAGPRRAPDRVRRHFSAEGPDILWVADVTYIPTGEGFLYLAVVLDVFSRRIVG
jgi:transposase InsO family protein